MTTTSESGRSGGERVTALVPPAPRLETTRRPEPGTGAVEPTWTPARVPAAPGSSAGVLDAYALQSDEIAALVEAWRATLPDTADTRRYAQAVLAALGELHVALDTAADLTRRRPQTFQPDSAPAVAVEEPEHISDDGLTALCGQSLIDPDPPQRALCPDCAAVEGRPYLWRRLTARVRRTR